MITWLRELKYFHAVMGLVMVAITFLPCSADLTGRDCCTTHGDSEPGGCCDSACAPDLLELTRASAETATGGQGQSSHLDAPTCSCPCHLPAITVLPFGFPGVLVPLGRMVDVIENPQSTTPACIDHPPRHA